MQRQKRRQKNRKIPLEHIPDEIVLEILSWLPVRDVLRFKTVCKLWRGIASEPTFLNIHTSRAPSLRPLVMVSYGDLNRGQYLYCAGVSNGLMCFQNRDKSFTITNPAIRKSLRLPPVHRTSLEPSFCYIPSTGEYKIANFFYSPGRDKYVCEVLKVGKTEASFQPREIEVPTLLRHILRCNFALKTGTMSHFFRTLQSSIEIATFDLETEVFRSKSIPLSRFNVRSLEEKFVWDDRLCLASVVKNKLIAFVLEDYERDEWRKQEVVLPIKSEEFEEKITPLLFEENNLQLRMGMNKIVVYNIRNGQIETTAYDCKYVTSVVPHRKPTLVAFHGMI
ncbi:F-box protein At5g65850-like [Aristolochia californica]|uniref:F-box protein At5g65850-like n=1 Tax=Aristolochia californica TaxID=171875 RepID=UPI0035D5CC37